MRPHSLSATPLAVALPLTLLLLALHPQPTHGGMYLPLSYDLPFGKEECLYERITVPDEYLTASLFVVSGEELSAAIVLEGPIAPVDLDPLTTKNAGGELRKYLDRYAKEGMNMFVNGKFGDSMLNVRPVRLADIVNFEEEEEDYYDDYYITNEEREDFNAHHDLEHQHPPRGEPVIAGRRTDLADDEMMDDAEHREERKLEDEEEEETGEEEEKKPRHKPHRTRYPEDVLDDEYEAMRHARGANLKRMVDAEGRIDDDFVKSQMARRKGMMKKMAGKGQMDMQNMMKKMKTKGSDTGMPKGPQRRTIVTPDSAAAVQKGEEGEAPRRRLREREEVKLVAGEPYQKTITVSSPGWYRFCVHGKSTEVTVEFELRKSSVYGAIDERTGHVPLIEELETHSEIRHLYEDEDDPVLKEEEAGIKDDDLRATKEQLRLLERVYSDIINKQLEERRTWNWRTIKNQHLYSHLVLGNLVETIVYMGITGWQVYTIRRWFGGGPTLGR